MPANDYPAVINGGPVDAITWFNPVAQDLTAVKANVATFKAVVTARLTAPQNLDTSSTTLQDVIGMSWAADAGLSFLLRLVIYYTATSATPDLKVGFSGPAAATLDWGAMHLTTGAAMTVISGLSIGSALPIGADTPSWKAEISGVFTTSSTPGSLQLRAAQNTSDAATVTIKAGTHGTLTGE